MKKSCVTEIPYYVIMRQSCSIYDFEQVIKHTSNPVISWYVWYRYNLFNSTKIIIISIRKSYLHVYMLYNIKNLDSLFVLSSANYDYNIGKIDNPTKSKTASPPPG